MKHLLVTLTIVLSCGSTQLALGQSQSQTAFFAEIKKLCGKSFEGTTEFPQNADHPLVGRNLLITVGPCADKEIRIPFQVADDKSRTWILTLDEKGLLFKHDHRHADGTPDEVTMYGGWATADGSSQRQQFPADSDTKKLIPEAATNVWTIEIGGAKQELVYSLERHAQPRYRAVFKLTPLQK